MLLDALMRMDREQLRLLAARGGGAVRGHGAGPAGRRRVLPLPHAAAARRRRPRRQDDGSRRSRTSEIGDGAFDERLAQRRVRGPAQGAEGDDRGRDPPPARRRPRRRGDGAHAAQAAARRRRLHARVARRDAAAAAGDLPADARARGAARAAAPAPPPRHLDFRQTVRHSMSYGGVPGRAEVQAAATVEAGDHGGRRHLGVGRVASPASRCSSSTRCRASSRRCGRGCSSTASTRSPASSTSPTSSARRSTGSTPKPTSCGSTATPTTATRSRCGTSATSARSRRSRRSSCSATRATTTTRRRRGRWARCASGPASVFWLDPEPRGYWDTGDSIVSEYAPYCDGVYEVRNLRQLQKFVADVVGVLRDERTGVTSRPIRSPTHAGSECRRVRPSSWR